MSLGLVRLGKVVTVRLGSYRYVRLGPNRQVGLTFLIVLFSTGADPPDVSVPRGFVETCIEEQYAAIFFSSIKYLTSFATLSLSRPVPHAKRLFFVIIIIFFYSAQVLRCSPVPVYFLFTDYGGKTNAKHENALITIIKSIKNTHTHTEGIHTYTCTSVHTEHEKTSSERSYRR